jgi:hypothetical protein
MVEMFYPASTRHFYQVGIKLTYIAEEHASNKNKHAAWSLSTLVTAPRTQREQPPLLPRNLAKDRAYRDVARQRVDQIR